MSHADRVSSHRSFLKPMLISALAMLAVASRLAHADTLSVGVEVEFVERIAVRETAMVAGGMEAREPTAASIDDRGMAIEISVTPRRQLSIHASIEKTDGDADPIEMTCASGHEGNQSCAAIAVSGVTAADGRLVVSVPDIAADTVPASAGIEVTIAHH